MRIIKKLFSSKSKKHATGEAAESRVDYISDHLGIVKEEVINIINLLREEKILADAKDLTAFIRRGENKNRSLNIVDIFRQTEYCLVQAFDEQEKTFHLKELNEDAEAQGCEGRQTPTGSKPSSISGQSKTGSSGRTYGVFKESCCSNQPSTQRNC